MTTHDRDWRPENWENPYPHLANLAPAYMARYAFEAGANAMLAAVREEVGKVGNPYQGHTGTHHTGSPCGKCAFEECREDILALLKKKEAQ